MEKQLRGQELQEWLLSTDLELASAGSLEEAGAAWGQGAPLPWSGVPGTFRRGLPPVRCVCGEEAAIRPECNSIARVS